MQSKLTYLKYAKQKMLNAKKSEKDTKLKWKKKQTQTDKAWRHTLL